MLGEFLFVVTFAAVCGGCAYLVMNFLWQDREEKEEEGQQAMEDEAHTEGGNWPNV